VIWLAVWLRTEASSRAAMSVFGGWICSAPFSAYPRCGTRPDDDRCLACPRGNGTGRAASRRSVRVLGRWQCGGEPVQGWARRGEFVVLVQLGEFGTQVGDLSAALSLSPLARSRLISSSLWVRSVAASASSWPAFLGAVGVYRRRLVQVLGGDGQWAVAGERRVAGEHGVEHAAQGVQVGAGVDRVPGGLGRSEGPNTAVRGHIV
jgi:hypothetical protein